MDFYAVLDQVLELLQTRGRVAYRALKRQFDLDDDYLEDLKDALLYAHPQVIDDGRGLVWSGAAETTPAPRPTPSRPTQQADAQVDPTAQVEPPPAAPAPPEAQRRQLTVMFCDLVGSTPLSEHLDPEDLREVVRAYQATCDTVIQRFDGHIAQYLGDGLLVYFGYPQAHEDDAQRAVRAGLGIIEAIAVLNTGLEHDKGVRLAVRLGIHTGLVVVGEMGGERRQEQLALGETPNVASRLQGLAPADAVVISATTARLVQGYFVCEDLGTHALKGLTAPMRVLHVLHESAAQSRLEAAAPTGLTPLVGRESEVTLLLERWAQSKDGLGQVVLISGEAGIGKSRLVEALREQVVREGSPRIAFRCSPYHTNSALYPVIEHMQRLLQFHRDDTPAVKLDKLERVLSTYSLALEEVIPLFASLLSIPLPDGRYPLVRLSPQQQRHQTQEALAAWLLEEAERQPVLTVCEDVHWADPSTLELLTLIIDQAPTARMLMLLTWRPEFRPLWPIRSYLTQLTLARLTRSQVEMMIAQVMRGKPLPTEVVEQVMAKTDGVPLFVEELLKMILESGLLREEEDRYVLTGPLPPLAIPATLQGSLMARLDRLAPVKEIAQLGAVLGREFAYETIQAMAPMGETALQHGLTQLVEAELLFQRGRVPHTQYFFKHALIQEAAYQSLLKSTRQRYHRQIAQVLEAQFPETVETQPELVAHHYTEAGLPQQAIAYWQRAGQQASERSANIEAINHFTTGLALLQTLPETPERMQHELALHIPLGAALLMTKGHGAPEVAATYTRARELCRQLGDIPELFPVLFGLWRFYIVRPELQTTRELGEQLLHLAQRSADLPFYIVAHYALGFTSLCLGDLALGRTHLEEGIALYAPAQRHSQVFRTGQDPGVACRSYTALALWLLGYPDQALQRTNDALVLAHQLAHPFSLDYALNFAAIVHELRREGQAAQEYAEAAITLATEQGFALWLAMGTLLRGWACAAQGQPVEGLGQMRQGLSAFRATGAEVFVPYLLAPLAEAYGNIGQIEAGLRVLAEALALVEQHAERWWEAELHRLKGELLLSQSPGTQTEAEACFYQALAVSHSQQAKSLELRAAMSLSRLWQQQGKRQQAYDLLAPVYNWFTEGFDTADLQEAQALLEVLAV